MTANESVIFWTAGVPAPQGSKRHVGGGRLIEASKKVAPWRKAVAAAATVVMIDKFSLLWVPWSGDVSVSLDFVLPRPKSLARSRPTPPAIKRPDLDKLERAVLDALTGVVFADDSQVTVLQGSKRIAEPDEPTGAIIKVVSFGPGSAFGVPASNAGLISINQRVSARGNRV